MPFSRFRATFSPIKVELWLAWIHSGCPELSSLWWKWPYVRYLVRKFVVHKCDDRYSFCFPTTIFRNENKNRHWKTPKDSLEAILNVKSNSFFIRYPQPEFLVSFIDLITAFVAVLTCRRDGLEIRVCMGMWWQIILLKIEVRTIYEATLLDPIARI